MASGPRDSGVGDAGAGRYDVVRARAPGCYGQRNFDYDYLGKFELSGEKFE
jgi:hypothetical protein